MPSNSFKFDIPETLQQKKVFYQRNTGSNSKVDTVIVSENDSSGKNYKPIPRTQEEKMNFYQDNIQPNYIAPDKNKNIDGVLNDDAEHSFFYGPNYIYGNDEIVTYQQVIDTGGGGTTVEALIWNDM